MPNRNKAVFLPETLDSLRNQTLYEIEIIIVDDDSTDDSRDIIKSYEKKDLRIRSIFLDPVELHVSERIDRARNIGNKEARADIICVHDSDDLSLPRRAEVTYGCFKENPECDLFYSAYHQRDRYGNVDERIPDFLPAVEFSERRLKKGGLFFIGHLTLGYKKETILKYPYNSDAGVGDWGLLYNLLVKKKVNYRYSVEPLCVYRVLDNALKGWLDDEHIEHLRKKKQKKMELLGELKNI